MRGNSFGKLFSITSFGESHGLAMGVVIDGMPAGIEINTENLYEWLKRRAPGHRKGTTDRFETDRPEILSGLFEGKTLGSPIAVIVRNENQRSEDYKKLKDDFRPGHADETTLMKYGVRDHRGGGRASGRETVARVIGGYFASLITPEIAVSSHILSVGSLKSDDEQEISKYLETLKNTGESCGGKCEILAKNIPSGLGEPAFDKLKADLAKALLSIGGVVAFSFGNGEEMDQMFGSEVAKSRSYFGGIEGGISNGEPLRLVVNFKPTSTVGEKAKEGRHDPCIMIRALVVLESMVYLTLADHFLRQNAYQVN